MNYTLYRDDLEKIEPDEAGSRQNYQGNDRRTEYHPRENDGRAVRISHAPGGLVDDSKTSTPRGIAMKIFNVKGPNLSPFENIDTQDFVFDTGKQFIAGGPKVFLQNFNLTAKTAPRLPETVKGAVSSVSRANAALDTVGLGSAKLDFYGHPVRHPMAEASLLQAENHWY